MTRFGALIPLLLAGLLAACTKGGDAPPPTARPIPPRAVDFPADMVLVEEGPAVLGSNRVDTEGRAREFGSRRPWYLDEHPLRTIGLPAFAIDRTEVTEQDYVLFVAALDYPPPPHWEGDPPQPVDRHLPVTNVTWMDAQNFCHWRGARLPTEAEWEKAARGPEGREYPYGDTFDREAANVGQLGEIAPAGHFETSVSPYGALDMAGNVWEWTASWYLPYPGNTASSELYGRRHKVLRGGSGNGSGHYQLEQLTTRGAYRFFLDPRMRQADVGFRCVQRLGPEGAVVADADDMQHG
ncbi:MAG: formylglycine-generating enzyme family protein [Nitrospirota bacterium]|nr:formylglycine-generating enzyme family protein [Nitrospirota bacterium]